MESEFTNTSIKIMDNDLDQLTSFLLTSDPSLSSLVDDILALPEAEPTRPRSLKEWITLQAESKDVITFSDENALQFSSEGNFKIANNNSKNNSRSCSICHEFTSARTYFGAVACDSCRVFFSRVVKRGAADTLKCKIGAHKCTVRRFPLVLYYRESNEIVSGEL